MSNFIFLKLDSHGWGLRFFRTSGAPSMQEVKDVSGTSV